MSKPEVLPCPFCGAEPLEHAIEPHSHGGALKALGVPDHPGSHFIECGCGAGMIAEAKQAVRDMWNRREAFTYQDARIAELEAAIKAPETVFLNMKRGAIATPSVKLWSKLFGEVLNDDDARLVEIARLRERLAELEDFAREIIKQYPNPNLTHEQFRVHACKHAEAVMAKHDKETKCSAKSP